MLESAVYQDYEPSLHRRKSISLPVEPTVTVMKADSPCRLTRRQCVSSMRKVPSIIWYESRREVIAVGQHKNLRDQKEPADIEGEVQMGTTRADGRRRLDEKPWEQFYDVATVARWCPINRGRLSIVDEDRELAMRKANREPHKRNLRPHQQVEQEQTGEYDRRNVVGCSHTIKVDEASDSDP